MSNEMISVPREQLQRWLDDIGNSRHVTEYAARKREELRALLAKPAKSPKSECPHCLGDSMFGCAECEPDDLSQPQGEPVAMVRTHGSVCWEEITGESLELCQAQPEEYEVRILYTRPAEQTAPDGFEIARHAKRLVEQLRERVAELEKQPAPVAVVLPERPYADEEEQQGMTDYEIGLGHGACEMWDKIKRLNIKRPMRANPPPGTGPSGTHRDNDGLDEWRKP